MLLLNEEHKKHLQFLSEQPLPVFQDFCKLAINYLENGPNYKVNNAAAQKFNVDSDTLKTYIEAIVHLLTESSKSKLNSEGFQQLLNSNNFDDEKQHLLGKLYQIRQPEITSALRDIGFKLPEYHDLEWRFETQIASRSALQQLEPLITLDFVVNTAEQCRKLQHICLQSDVTNLLHLTQELEVALQESRSQEMRKIKRTMK